VFANNVTVMKTLTALALLTLLLFPAFGPTASAFSDQQLIWLWWLG
jgi:hypothetical protein